MEIKNLIKIYDNILPLNTLSNFIRAINTFKFKEGEIWTNKDTVIVDKNIRNVEVFSLADFKDDNLTAIHWANLFLCKIKENIDNYKNDLNLKYFYVSSIDSIDILKYENNGFYTWHIDAGTNISRTLSIVYLLNNDYEGGNLCFKNPNGSGEWEVEVIPNRMIIWPSNFLYPHTVKPVTKGKRYSIVSWVK
jgi:hypothetical protein